jgi:hypothetical protein
VYYGKKVTGVMEMSRIIMIILLGSSIFIYNFNIDHQPENGEVKIKTEKKLGEPLTKEEIEEALKKFQN